jgi:hypothetical protein
MRALIRSLRRHPPSTAAAILMAAIGIALLTLALAVHDAATTRPLPFPGARDLLVVSTTHQSPGAVRTGVGWSFPRLQFVRERTSTLELVSPWRPASVTLGLPEAQESVSGEFVSADYSRSSE